MARPERIEEDDDARRDEQRDLDTRRPSVLDRRGPVGVPAGNPVADNPVARTGDATRDTVARAEEDTRVARDAAVRPETQASAGNSAHGADAETVWGNESEIREFRSRWSSIQTAFVDEPRQAVREADQLVQSVIKTLSDRFTHEREELVRQWDRGDNVSTEDLRISMQRYRTYLDRLLDL